MVQLPGSASSSSGQPHARVEAPLDPLRFVSFAEQALLQGDREEAAALIAEAYLLFDLLALDCE